MFSESHTPCLLECLLLYWQVTFFTTDFDSSKLLFADAFTIIMTETAVDNSILFWNVLLFLITLNTCSSAVLETVEGQRSALQSWPNS